MAWTTLKAAIDAIFTTNGSNQITGLSTRTIVKQIVDEVGQIQFKGKATPATDPGTYDGERMYLTTESGTYPNFGGLVVGADKLAVFVNSGGAWAKTEFDLPSGGGGGGSGDMEKSTYDSNDDGKVDGADSSDEVSGTTTANQYYGTNSSNTKGFHDLPSGIMSSHTTTNDFPSTGNTQTLYYSIQTDLAYRWDGSQYVEALKKDGRLSVGALPATGLIGYTYYVLNDGFYYWTGSQFNPMPVSGGGGGSGEQNVQSDWDQSDDTQDDYIQNKPKNVGGQYGAITNYFSNQTDVSDDFYMPYYYNTEDDFLNVGTPIEVVSISGNDVTLNRLFFIGQDFAAVNGHKWVLYKNSITPIATIEDYNIVTGVFTVNILQGTLSVGDEISLFNPFTVYESYDSEEDNDFFIADGLERGNTIDGKTVLYPTPAQILKIGEEFIFITMVLFTNGTRDLYISKSKDFKNWSTPQVWLTDTDFPTISGISSIQAVSFVEYSGDVANAKYFGVCSVFTSSNNFRQGAYILLDEDLNPLPEHGFIPMLAGDNDTSQRHYNHVICMFENKLFMTSWEFDGSSDNSPQVIFEFYKKTGSLDTKPTLDDIIAGNADYTKTVLTTGNAGQVGILGGHSDQATPFIYKGNLYCSISGQSDQSWCIGKDNRNFTIAKYDNGKWHVTGRPFVMNPVEWQTIDGKYQWCRDHIGGRFQISEINNKLIMTCTMNNGTDTYEIFVASMLNKNEANMKKSYNPSGNGVKNNTQFVGTDGNLYFKSGAGTVSQLN